MSSDFEAERELLARAITDASKHVRQAELEMRRTRYLPWKTERERAALQDPSRQEYSAALELFLDLRRQWNELNKRCPRDLPYRPAHRCDPVNLPRCYRMTKTHLDIEDD